MLKKLEGSNETYYHVCNNKRKGYEPPIKIYIHDITAYIEQEKDGKIEHVTIKHCPFCGVDVDSDR